MGRKFAVVADPFEKDKWYLLTDDGGAVYRTDKKANIPKEVIHEFATYLLTNTGNKISPLEMVVALELLLECSK